MTSGCSSCRYPAPTTYIINRYLTLNLKEGASKHKSMAAGSGHSGRHWSQNLKILHFYILNCPQGLRNRHLMVRSAHFTPTLHIADSIKINRTILKTTWLKTLLSCFSFEACLIMCQLFWLVTSLRRSIRSLQIWLDSRWKFSGIPSEDEF